MLQALDGSPSTSARPPVQAVHDVAPSHMLLFPWQVVVPAGQASHCIKPSDVGSVPNRPAVHEVQDVDSASENVPPSHKAHAVIPAAK